MSRRPLPSGAHACNAITYVELDRLTFCTPCTQVLCRESVVVRFQQAASIFRSGAMALRRVRSGAVVTSFVTGCGLDGNVACSVAPE
jgi:hypothetical protein